MHEVTRIILGRRWYLRCLLLLLFLLLRLLLLDLLLELVDFLELRLPIWPQKLLLIFGHYRILMLVHGLLINILFFLDSTWLNANLCFFVLLFNNSYQFLGWLLNNLVFTRWRQLVNPENVRRCRLHSLVIIGLLVIVLVHRG